MTTDNGKLLIVKDPEVASLLRDHGIPVFVQMVNNQECFAVSDCDNVRKILFSSRASFDNLIIGKTNRITFN